MNLLHNTAIQRIKITLHYTIRSIQTRLHIPTFKVLNKYSITQHSQHINTTFKVSNEYTQKHNIQILK